MKIGLMEFTKEQFEKYVAVLESTQRPVHKIEYTFDTTKSEDIIYIGIPSAPVEGMTIKASNNPELVPHTTKETGTDEDIENFIKGMMLLGTLKTLLSSMNPTHSKQQKESPITRITVTPRNASVEINGDITFNGNVEPAEKPQLKQFTEMNCGDTSETGFLLHLSQDGNNIAIAKEFAEGWKYVYHADFTVTPYNSVIEDLRAFGFDYTPIAPDSEEEKTVTLCEIYIEKSNLLFCSVEETEDEYIINIHNGFETNIINEHFLHGLLLGSDNNIEKFFNMLSGIIAEKLVIKY